MEETSKKPKEIPKKEEAKAKEPPHLKKSSKIIYGLILLLVIINIVVFAVIFGGRTLGKKGGVAPDLLENINDIVWEETNTNTNTNTDTNINTSINTNTSDKVTYFKSTGLGLSIGLKPPYELASEVKASEDFFQAVTYDDTQSTAGVTGLKIEIVRENNKENLTLLEWAAQHEASDDPEITFKESKVDNLAALEREVLTNFEASRTIYVAKSKKVYVINIGGDRDSYDTYSAITQSIIDSISFTK